MENQETDHDHDAGRFDSGSHTSQHTHKDQTSGPVAWILQSTVKQEKGQDQEEAEGQIYIGRPELVQDHRVGQKEHRSQPPGPRTAASLDNLVDESDCRDAEGEVDRFRQHVIAKGHG